MNVLMAELALTDRRVRLALRRTRVMAELVRSVVRAPLPFAERLRCLRVVWGDYRYWRFMRGELRGLLPRRKTR